MVELKPEKPEININQPFFCLKDIIKLSVPAKEGITYAWSGPNNYSAPTNAVEIPVTDFNLAGQYQVILTSGSCNSEPATIIVPAIARIPVAKFYTEPTFDVKFSAPVPIHLPIHRFTAIFMSGILVMELFLQNKTLPTFIKPMEYSGLL